MGRKTDWLMDKLIKFIRCFPYLVWWSSIFLLGNKELFITIPLVEFQVGIDQLGFFQFGLLMMYLGFRESKFLA